MAAMTPQTIIGIFETSEEAEKARQLLMDNGFEDHSIELDNHVDTVDELVTDGQMTDTTESSPDSESDETREGAILTVRVADPGRLVLATDILTDCGATDVNEFSEPEGN